MALASPAATPGDLRAAFDGSRALVTGGLSLIGSALARLDADHARNAGRGGRPAMDLDQEPLLADRATAH